MAVSEDKLRQTTSLLWTVFGFGLAVSSYLKQQYLIAFLGLFLGAFWAFTSVKTWKKNL
ncbi:MAG: hypothetical protein ABNH00_13090 [Dokdonia sp.]|jgi:positive regulator of sigma E activity